MSDRSTRDALAIVMLDGMRSIVSALGWEMLKSSDPHMQERGLKDVPDLLALVGSVLDQIPQPPQLEEVRELWDAAVHK